MCLLCTLDTNAHYYGEVLCLSLIEVEPCYWALHIKSSLLSGDLVLCSIFYIILYLTLT